MSNSVKLKDIASARNNHINDTFEESERYGQGFIFRKFGFYPQFLPLRVVIHHGPSQWDFVEQHIFNYKNYNIGFYSDRFVNELKDNKSFRKVFKIMSPFAFYRNSKKIKPSNFARGSLFFYAHSTYWTDNDTSFDELLTKFKEMPEEFQPIDICMYFVDIQKGLHEKFIEFGYNVYCAGNWYNRYFIKNFYEILTKYKYTFSNLIGSYTFYSVECGIPFSLIDLPITTSRNTDENIIKSGKSVFDHQQFKRCIKIFSGTHLKISKEQQKLVNDELGIHGGISRLRFAYILYFSFFNYKFQKFIIRAKNILILYFNLNRKNI